MTYKNPRTYPKKGAPGMEQAVLEMCAWGLFAIYIYIYIYYTSLGPLLLSTLGGAICTLFAHWLPATIHED